MLWFFASDYTNGEKIFEVVGTISVNIKYKYGGVGTRQGSGWDIIKYCADRQFAFEKMNPAPIKKMTIIELAKRRPWWKFW